MQRTLPRVERVTLPGLGHDGRESDGKRELVAQKLLRFIAQARPITRALGVGANRLKPPFGQGGQRARSTV
jgi:hypothetical protein